MKKFTTSHIERLIDQIVATSGRRLLLFAVLTICVVLIHGYHIGTFDQSSHIPFLKKLADQSMYPKDPFLDLQSTHYSYFWFAFIPFQKLGVLEEALFATHLVSIFLTFFAIWRLSFTLFRNKLASFLSVIMFVMPHLSFAAFTIFEFSLLNRTFVLPFLLFAFDLYLKKRMFLAFLLLGLLYNVHVISVHFAIGLLLFDCLMRIKTVGIKKIIVSLFLFVLPALPIFLWKLGNSPVDFSFRPEWFTTLNTGLMHTVFVAFSSESSVLLLSLGGISSIVLFFWLRSRLSNVPHMQTLTHFYIAIILILLLEVVITSGFPSTIFVQSQIIRVGLYATFFSYLLMGEFIARAIVKKTLQLPDALILTAASLFSLSPIILLTTLFLQKISLASVRYVVSIIFIALSFVAFLTIAQKNAIWDPSINIYPKKTPWYEVQAWAKEQTPKDAVFITPPYMWWFYTPEWRVFSERATVGTLADLLEIAFEPKYLSVWKPRFESVAPGALNTFQREPLTSLRITKDAYNSLSESDLQKIAKTYKATYVVVEKPKALQLPMIYENTQFIVYTVQQ